MNNTNQQVIEQDLKKWYDHIPNLYHGAFRRVWLRAIQRKSMAAAIKAKCQDCMCWANSEIPDCGIYHCPLYPYRPRAHDKADYSEAAARVVARSARQKAPSEGATE